MQGVVDCPFYTPYLNTGGFTGQVTNNIPASAPVKPTAPTITVGELGNVTGVTTQSGRVNTYYSVPFAATPVRFAFPVDAPAFANGTHDGTASTPLCIQGNGSGVEEGCLCLSINVPVGPAPAGGWPVFLFYPGGSFVNTGGNDMALITGNNMNM